MGAPEREAINFSERPAIAELCLKISRFIFLTNGSLTSTHFSRPQAKYGLTDTSEAIGNQN